MKFRQIVFAAIVCLLGPLAYAQPSMTAITATNIRDFAGNPLSSGKITFTPGDNFGNPIAARGAFFRSSYCYIVAGAITTSSTGGTCQVVDALASNPSVCYKVGLFDSILGQAIPTPGQICAQPTGSTWSYDSYVPNMAPAAIVQVGPKGDTGNTGATGTAATIAVGNVSTLVAGSPATVINRGTANAAILDIGIPQGPAGGATTGTQPGQTITSPTGGSLIATPGFPTASKVRTGALTMSIPSFNCATIADPAGQQFCQFEQAINFGAGLAAHAPNNLYGNAAIWFNLSNASSISSLIGSHTLTQSTGGTTPRMYRGSSYANSVRFGYNANTADQAGSGTSNVFTDTNGNDFSCYAYAQLGLDCTIVLKGRSDTQQWNTGGTQLTNAQLALNKSHGPTMQIGKGAKVGMYDATSAGFLYSNCPAQYTFGSFGQPTTVSTTDLFYFLLVSHTGTVSCAIEDGTASTPTSFTFANDTTFSTTVGGATTGSYIEAVGVFPSLLTQAQRAALTNNRYNKSAPNFTTPDWTLLDQYQFQCADFRDQKLCQTYTNGSVGGGTGTYLGTHGAANVTFKVDSKRIYFSANPGVSVDSNFGVAVHVNGVLACQDSFYATDRQNMFGCNIGNTTGALQTINIRIGGGRGNINAVGLSGVAAGDDYAQAVLYSGLQGGFIDSVYVPKGAQFVPPQSVPAPTSIAVVFSDSIFTGNGSQYNAAVGGFIPLELYSPGGNSFGTDDVALLGTGSVSTWNACPTQAACDAYMAAMLPANTTYFIDERIVNDKLHGCALTGAYPDGPEGLANYTLSVGYLYNSVHTLVPSAHVIALGALQDGQQPPTSVDGCPSSTHTMADYSAAKSSVCSAKNTAWGGTGDCVFYDMTDAASGCPALATSGDFATDNIHTTEQGTRKAVICLRNKMGVSNPTSVSNPI